MRNYKMALFHSCFVLMVLMLCKIETVSLHGTLANGSSMGSSVTQHSRRIREALPTKSSPNSHQGSPELPTGHVTNADNESTTAISIINTNKQDQSVTDSASSQLLPTESDSNGYRQCPPCASSLRIQDCNQENSSKSASNEKTQTLYVLSLLPYPDPIFPPSWGEGPTLYLAAQLAVELINECTHILPGFRLELVQGDSGCDIESKAYLTFLSDLLNAKKNIAGIVGPGCSTSATAIAPLSAHNGTALINIHIAGSLLLTNRTRYPYSFGTLDSTEIFVDSLLSLMDLNDWSKIAALYDETRVFYYSTLQLFENQLQNKNQSYFSSAVYETFIPLDVIKEKNIRIVILFVGPNYISQILCLAYHFNMTYPQFQFVVISRTSDEIVPVKFKYDRRSYVCGNEEMNSVKNGVLIIHYQLRAKSKPGPQVGLLLEEFDQRYQGLIDDYNMREITAKNSTMELLRPSFWAPSYFDTVWSLALALHHSMDYVNLSNYRYGDVISTNIIRDNLLGTVHFIGLSGYVKFRNMTGYVTRNVDIYQIDLDGNMKTIAVYMSLNSSIVLLSDEAKFINGSFTTKIVYAHVVSKLVGGIFATVSLLGFVLVVTLQILTLIYRKKVSVKASSPNFSQITFFGCYFLILGLLSYFCIETFSGHFSPVAECRLWDILNYSVLLGSSIIFSSICARMYRLYRIYVHFKNPGNFISTKVLLVFVAGMVSVAVLLCILWAILNPFTPELVHNRAIDNGGYVDGEGEDFVLVDRISIRCESANYHAWFGGTSSVYWILILVALWLALRTRNIPHRHFQTNSVMLLVYVLSSVTIVGLPVYFISARFDNEDITIEFVTLNMLINIVVYSICLLLFLPPLVPVLRTKLVMSDICVSSQ